jgi:hypothetical protein
MEGLNIIILAVFLLLFWLALRVIPMTFTRRAAAQVIRIFREHEAVGVYNAKTVDDLGLNPPGMVDRLMKTRDYKPMALSILTRTDVIRQTGDGKLYLSESGLRDYCRKDPKNRLGICNENVDRTG